MAGVIQQRHGPGCTPSLDVERLSRGNIFEVDGEGVAVFVPTRKQPLDVKLTKEKILSGALGVKYTYVLVSVLSSIT